MIKRTLPAAAGLLWLLCAGGCKQGLGDRCQLDTDCEDTLYCELGGNSVAMGGSCRSKTGAVQDMSVAADQSRPPDLTPSDLPLSDLRDPDAGDGT